MDGIDYKKILDQSSIGYAYHKLLYDKDGKPCDYVFLEANQSFEELTGLRAADIIGKKVTEALPGITEDEFDWIAFYGEIVQKGLNKDFKQYSAYLKKEYLVNVFSPVKDHFVTIVSFPSESLADFHLVFNNMPNSGMILKVTGNGGSRKDYVIQDINYEVVKREGKPKSEMIGKSLRQYHPNVETPDLVSALKAAWETGEPQKLSHSSVHEDGKTYYYETEVFKLSSNMIVSLYSDVTERIQAQKILEETTKELQTYIAEAPNGIFIADENGRYIQVNKNACETTGYNEIELLEKSISDLIAPEHMQKAINGFTQLQQMGFLDANLIYITKNGEKRWWNVRATKLSENTYLGFTVDITKTRTLEEKLRESEYEYRELFDTSGVGIGYFDVQGKVKWVNRIEAKYLGGNPAEYIGKSIFDIFPQEIADRYFKRLISTADSREAREYEDMIVLDGKPHHFRSIYNCITNKDKQLLGIQIVSSDVSDLRNSQIALAESEMRFRAIFNQSVFGIITTSLDCEIIDANKKASEIFGYDTGDIAGMNLKSFTHEEDTEKCSQKFNSLLSGQQRRIKFETRYIKRTGETILAEITATIIDDENGDHLFLIATIDDITEKIKTQNTLKRFEAISNSYITGNAFTDLNGNIVYINDYFARTHGYQKDELLGKNLSFLHTQEQMKTVNEIINQLKNKSYMNPAEVWHIKKNGKEFPMLMSGILMKNDAGKPEYMAVSAIDISNYKELEEKNINMQMILQNQQKLESIGTLASGVAHEINNPINGIMNYSQLIADSAGEESTESFFAGEIIKESKRIAGIIQSLLQFSRQEKKTYSLANISDIVASTLTLMNAIMKHDFIDFSVSVADDLHQVKCRSQQIQQVIMNLLTNARDALNDKYGNEHSKKKIELKAVQITKNDKRYIQISVKDNGNGIPSEIESQIYDPFFTTKPRDKGTGLGLAISYGIIQEHGGEIYFKSAKGKYTEFFVELPAAEEGN